MSLVKDNVWKLLAPLVVMGVMFLIPVFDGMSPQAQHHLAMFVVMIVGMIPEPTPATAISSIAVTICAIGNNHLLFDAKELADPAFNAQEQALRRDLAGFPNTTIWLIFGALIFALGYEVSELSHCIAFFLMKFMDERTPTLGYVIAIIDTLLAPLIPSNTTCTGGMVFPVVKDLPPLFRSFPNDPSARCIGGYLVWMMVISTSLSSPMFVIGAAPSVLGLELVSKIVGIQINWLQWFLCFLPIEVILFIIAPWLFYVLYKPKITHSEEVATWTGDELKTMGVLTHREWMLIGPVLLSLGLWVFGNEVINAIVVGLLTVSLMLVLYVVPQRDITRYNSAWSMLVNLATLAVMANGLTRSGLIDRFTNMMSTHLEGFSPDVTVVVLVLVLYLAHYLFASLSVHTATMLPAIPAVGKGIPGVPMEQLCILLVLSIGIMGCLMPHAAGPGVIIYGCGYVRPKDYWCLGAIFGVICISVLLLVGWPILAMWD